MTIKLQQSVIYNSQSVIQITGSKSESNRLLLLQALYPNLNIENLSNSDDSKVMEGAFQDESHIIDIHHAGTAMRFLTAYFSIQQGREVTLTGSTRMKERPIKILVDALTQLGADIKYVENDGYPPLRIKGKTLKHSSVSLQAHVSSQYISALLLIGAKLERGIALTLQGEMTSTPYVKMTLDLLNQIGIETTFSKNVISVKPKSEVETTSITVESDWSSASYFFSLIALSEIGTQVQLSSYRENSRQGDSKLVKLYESFGVQTVFEKDSITIKKVSEVDSNATISFNLVNTPDIAQTIAVTSLGLGLHCKLTGLHTLKIKETDRLQALKTELEKLGAQVEISEDSLSMQKINSIKNKMVIDTYNDHRMAMAFAPLALKTDIFIKDATVVSKSYPTFWDDLKALGIKVSE